MRDHFKDIELECKCCGAYLFSPVLKRLLSLARDIAGIPFVVTSGYRCPIHNKNIKGSTNSSHMKGEAVDISTPTSRIRYIVLHSLMLVGIRRFEIGPNYIHADIDKEKDDMVISIKRV